ncbi:MAG: hypothetical protein J3K34DRAFT_390491 [Monoraphidium minutum]|nr:MAG: hypothetical protein J3K34DRAFT_390491 [Monoraphidium minutum]
MASLWLGGASFHSLKSAPTAEGVTGVVRVTQYVEEFSVVERDAASLSRPNLRVLQRRVAGLDPRGRTIRTAPAGGGGGGSGGGGGGGLPGGERRPPPGSGAEGLRDGAGAEGLRDGAGEEVLRYDALCICAGARPKVVARHERVVTLRDTESVQEFARRLVGSRRVAVVGNGGIALELIGAVRGVELVWVMRHGHVGDTFFESEAAEFLLADMAARRAAAAVAGAEQQAAAASAEQQQAAAAGAEQQQAAAASSGDGGGGGPAGRALPGAALGPKWCDALPGGGPASITLERRAQVLGVYDTRAEAAAALLAPAAAPDEPAGSTPVGGAEVPDGGGGGDFSGGGEEGEWPVWLALAGPGGGRVLGADLVVSAIGVEPATEWLPACLERAPDGGLLVGADLRTSDPHIWAAGDCCTLRPEAQAPHFFQMRLWTQARLMGMWAAHCMAGRGDDSGLGFAFELFTHATRFLGRKAVFLGLFASQKLGAEPPSDVAVHTRALGCGSRGATFVRAVLLRGRLQGALLIGDTGLEEAFENLILDGLDLSGYGPGLLDPGVELDHVAGGELRSVVKACPLTLERPVCPLTPSASTMRPDEPLASSCAVLVNNKAFINSNGWPLGLLVSPQPPQSLPTPPIATPPPAWLAIVIDGAMADAALSAAAAGLAQALQQLPPHTHVLVSVADTSASFFDLAAPRPQAWVLAGGGAHAAPGATARALAASGVRPAQLAACAPMLQVALSSLRREGGGAADGGPGAAGDAWGAGAGAGAGPARDDDDAALEAERIRLGAAAAAIDLSLHLLGRGVAEWDARHKAELAAAAAAAPPPAQQQQPFPAKPMHAARVLFVTAGGGGGGAPLVAQDARLAPQYQSLFDALASKAASLDAQLDAVVGDAAAPALPFLADAAAASGGLLLHQPGLAAPLAANIAALCGRRLGWDAFLDVRTPAGVRVAHLVGPLLQPEGQLPASISPVDPQPLGGGRDGGGGGDGGGDAPSPRPAQQMQRAAPRVARPAVAATRLSSAAVAAAAIDRGRYYGAALELTSDLQPGVAQEVQVLWEWTTADGRRVRQVSSTQLQVGERLPDFLSGLDLECGSLLAARRLVAAAVNATGGVGGAGGAWGRPLKRGALADARLAAGLALQLAAQRMGTARQARRGIFGFGGQTDAGDAGGLLGRLVPLHADVLPLQAALLPALRELSPREHGELVAWHGAWGGPPADGGFGRFCAAAGHNIMPRAGLLELGPELQEHVLSFLDARSLASLGAVARPLRAFSSGSVEGLAGKLRLVERVARNAVLRVNKGIMEEATRHSRMGWLERLYVEECAAGFDRSWEVTKAEDAGFKFSADTDAGTPQVQLQGMGPKLLLSDASTADGRMLRWRLVVRGNTAVEFGVVPASMQYGRGDEGGKVHKSLHKCKHPDGSEFRENVGFSSAITVGSMLPFKVPLMKGSVVEVLAAAGRFEFLVVNPPGAQELFWSGAGHHARTVPKPYKGPQRFAMEQSFDADQDVRLALTCWAQGVFDVLQDAPAAAAAGGGACSGEQAGGGATASAGPSGTAAAVAAGAHSGGGPSGSGASGSSGATAAALNTGAVPLERRGAGRLPRHVPPPQQQQQQQQTAGAAGGPAPAAEIVDLTDDAPASPSDDSTAAR